jgi:hypothetical protein
MLLLMTSDPLHSRFFSVEETTYFGILFIFTPK